MPSLCVFYIVSAKDLAMFVTDIQKTRQFLCKNILFTKPRRVGLVDSVSESHAVGHGFASWPGHTKTLLWIIFKRRIRPQAYGAYEDFFPCVRKVSIIILKLMYI